MKGWIVAFGFLGVLGVVSALSNIVSFSATLGGPTVVAYHANVLSRVVGGTNGAVLVFFALATYRRRPWMWRLMFIYLGLVVIAGTLVLAPQFVREYRQDRILITIVTTTMTIAAAVYWGARWYKQKAYFFPDEEQE